MIAVPPELCGAAPGDILIVYPADERPICPTSRSSVWDAFGKAAHRRSTSEINAQIRTDRDSWDSR
jgi:hypothetical protein